MTTGSTVAAYAGIMVLTGMGIPMMATLNAGLGVRFGSPVAAAVVLFGVALIIAALAMAVAGGPQAGNWGAAPPQYYCGGLFVAAYVIAITAIAPRFGIGNAVFFVLVGQLASAALIDHFGLFGALRSELTLTRAAGVALMAVGVLLARKPV